MRKNYDFSGGVRGKYAKKFKCPNCGKILETPHQVHNCVSLQRAAKQEWRRMVPDRAGYWLRINAGGRVQMHHIFRIKPRGPLVINWGWSGEGGLCEVERISHKLGGFMWWDTGASTPPDPGERWVEPEKKGGRHGSGPRKV